MVCLVADARGLRRLELRLLLRFSLQPEQLSELLKLVSDPFVAKMVAVQVALRIRLTPRPSQPRPDWSGLARSSKKDSVGLVPYPFVFSKV